MAFSDFTLERAMDELGIEASLERVFEAIDPIEVPQWLKIVLERFSETPMLNERTRREAAIFPILAAGRELTNKGYTIYPGARLDSDPTRGLQGECGYLLSLGSPLPVLVAPILTVLLARSGDVESGIGECVAQMVGTILFNRQKGSTGDSVFGIVTNGNEWLFMQLQKNRLRLHPEHIYRNDLARLLSVLKWMVSQGTKIPKKVGKWIVIEPTAGGSRASFEKPPESTSGLAAPPPPPTPPPPGSPPEAPPPPGN